MQCDKNYPAGASIVRHVGIDSIKSLECPPQSVYDGTGVVCCCDGMCVHPPLSWLTFINIADNEDSKHPCNVIECSKNSPEGFLGVKNAVLVWSGTCQAFRVQ